MAQCRSTSVARSFLRSVVKPCSTRTPQARATIITSSSGVFAMRSIDAAESRRSPRTVLLRK